MTCSCGHEVIDHDGTGCTERVCPCVTPVDELLDPPTPESVRVDARSGALVFVYCGRCDAHALPHVH